MRKEASIEQWRKLYEAATKIKELKPWEKLWDMDLIGIRNGAEEDMVFFSILGHGGDCYGVVVYEGYEGLNTFLMLTMQEQLNLPVSYVMFSQKNLTCYWGNRDELSDKQRKIIKELGYKYRGKNQWLYFMSFEPGYYPYNLDENEVLRMTAYFQNLELALQCYKKTDAPVDFKNGHMFCVEFDKVKQIWNFGEKPLPFTTFQFGNLIITNEELLSELREVPKCEVILEADISIMGVALNDKKYERPANPAMCLIGDAVSGMILSCELQGPEDDAIVSLADKIIDFIFECGAPKEIRVTNILVEAGLEHICEVCGIKLRRVKKLSGLNQFIDGMKSFI